MNPRPVRFAVLFAALCLVSPVLVSAQEWSAAQKEVWKNVEAYWALDAAGDTAGFMAYFGDDYSGWSVDNAVPSDKATAQKFIAHNHRNTKTLVTDLKPAAIKIHGEIAIVHYFWTQISKSGAEKEKQRSGRWTDILQKRGDKWVLIADHGGASPSKDD